MYGHICFPLVMPVESITVVIMTWLNVTSV